MTSPDIKKGDWIKIKSSGSDPGIGGYVFAILPNEELSVGYYQNNTKPIKENVTWTGSYSKFKSSGPCGSYLSGNDELIVKSGPPKIK